MRFEIDVSGEDIFKRNFTICISEKKEGNNGIIKGFKFDREMIESILLRWKAGKYKYPFSEKKGLFKVRIYCIILLYLFKEINTDEKISLTICRDFKGHENTIEQTLKFFLEEKGNFKMGKPLFQKLPNDSKAHRYAQLMAKDIDNHLNTYVGISLEELELFLKWKKDLV